MPHLKTGLVSITFRQLRPKEVIRLVAQAGQQGIEWGGDVHVPHGDLRTAEQVGKATREAGLETACYGSYHRLGSDDPKNPTFAGVLETALALGTPSIRVWAGTHGSAKTSESEFARVVEEARSAGEQCADHGVRLVYEYHANTLTDTISSATRLLEETRHPGIATLWQPPNTPDRDHCLKSLQAALPFLHNIHVFHWSFDTVGINHRHPLTTGEASWTEYLKGISEIKGERYILHEFVQNDDPEQYLRDAATLRSWVEAV